MKSSLLQKPAPAPNTVVPCRRGEATGEHFRHLNRGVEGGRDRAWGGSDSVSRVETTVQARRFIEKWRLVKE